MKTILENQHENWFDELPIEIQNSVSIGLKQSENNEGISHKEAMIEIQNWLKKSH